MPVMPDFSGIAGGASVAVRGQRGNYGLALSVTVARISVAVVGQNNDPSLSTGFSGQQNPDTNLSFSSALAGAKPPLA